MKASAKFCKINLKNRLEFVPFLAEFTVYKHTKTTLENCHGHIIILCNTVRNVGTIKYTKNCLDENYSKGLKKM